MKNQSRHYKIEKKKEHLPVCQNLACCGDAQRKQIMNMDGHTLPVFSYKCTAKAKGLGHLSSADQCEN